MDSAPLQALSPELALRWQRAQMQIAEQAEGQKSVAAKVRSHLLRYPGYYAAAEARNQELLQAGHPRQHWHWAAERWAAIFEQGINEALRLLEDSETNQEILSSSPFTVMRPPLPENDYYQAYETTRS